MLAMSGSPAPLEGRCAVAEVLPYVAAEVEPEPPCDYRVIASMVTRTLRHIGGVSILTNAWQRPSHAPAGRFGHALPRRDC